MRERSPLELYTSANTTAVMKEYIRQHFGDLLGPYEVLLDKPGGLELLAKMVRSGQFKRQRVA